ncbi:MAG: polysaccharide deacetylase family protein [Christensenella sp.]|nr:polysaccharide deacetylase family protein [Christensenella sp.]
MQKYADYILRFLCDIENAGEQLPIYYGDAAESDCKIVIEKSDFFLDGVFGREKSLPKLPLRALDGMPVLFGRPETERRGERIIIHADLVASAFFLMTRYEETVSTGVRDRFGRFIGKESLPYRAGFIDRPLIDEYSQYIRGLLGLEKKTKQADVCLTHDVDVPYTEFNFISATKRIAANLIRGKGLSFYPYKNMTGNVTGDPMYIFDKLIETDRRAGDCKVVYFVKSGGNAIYDAPVYIYDKAYKKLRDDLFASGSEIGYHSSFQAGGDVSLMRAELEALERVEGRKITSHRSHFLRTREPSDMRELICLGITDDYTMGYADVAGFRIGTARTVNWIDPYTRELTDLKLHPLIAMDNTLTSGDYMGLDADGAVDYVCTLLSRSIGGSPSILWHNHTIYNSEVQSNIYERIISSVSGVLDIG